MTATNNNKGTAPQPTHAPKDSNEGDKSPAVAPARKPPRAPPPMLARGESNVDDILGALRKEELEENTLEKVQTAPDEEESVDSGGKKKKKFGRGLLRFQQLVEKERRWTRSKAANFNDLQFRGKCIEILCQKPESRDTAAIDSLLHFLFDNDFFLKFEMEQRRRIARIARWEIYKKDTVLFNQGDEGDKFYIILNGEVSVWIKNAEIEVKEEEQQKSLRERAEEKYGIVHDAPTVEKVEEVDEEQEQQEEDRLNSLGRISSRGRSANRSRSRSRTSQRSTSPPPGDKEPPSRAASRVGKRLSRTSSVTEGGTDSGGKEEGGAEGEGEGEGQDGGEGEGGEEEEEEEEDPMPGYTRVATLNVGDSFGELALLKSKPRAATITTNEATSFIVISKQDFKETLKSHHEDKLDSKVEFLRTVPALRHNSGPVISALSAFFTEVTLTRGTPILEEGTDKEEIQFCLIKSGSCRVSFDLKLNLSSERAAAQAALASNANRLMRLQSHLDGGGISKEEMQRAFQRGAKTKKVIDLALLEQGQHFGAIPILNGEESRYSVTSATMVELLVMSKQNFLKHTTQTDRSVIRKTGQLQHDAWLERIQRLSGSKEEERERAREEQRRREASERLVTKYTQQVRDARSGQGRTRKASGSSFLKLPPVIPGVQPCKTTDALLEGVKARLPHVFPADFDDLVTLHNEIIEAAANPNRQSESVKAAASEANKSCVKVSDMPMHHDGNTGPSFVTEVPGDDGDDEDGGEGDDGRGSRTHSRAHSRTSRTSQGMDADGARGGDGRAGLPAPPRDPPPRKSARRRTGNLTARSLGLERTHRGEEPELIKPGEAGFLSSRGLQAVPHPRRRQPDAERGYVEQGPGQHPPPPHTLALVPFVGIGLNDTAVYDPVARSDPRALQETLPRRHYPNTQFPTRGLSAMDTTFFDPCLGRNPTRTRVAVLAAGRSHLKHRRYSKRYDTIGITT